MNELDILELMNEYAVTVESAIVVENVQLKPMKLLFFKNESDWFYLTKTDDRWKIDDTGNCRRSSALYPRPQIVKPINMILHCPKCHQQHIDAPESHTGWTNPPHKSHKCGNCQTVWRPADVETNGVRFIETQGENDTVFFIYPF